MTVDVERPAIPVQRRAVVRDRWVPTAHRGMSEWRRSYAQQLVLLDIVMLTAAMALALLVRFGERPASVNGIPYVLIAAALVLSWSAALGVGRCYEARFLGHGADEYQRVANASVRLAAVVALVCFAFGLPLSRGFVAVGLVAGLCMLLLGRLLARQVVRAGRRRGRFVHRVLVVGSHPHVRALVAKLRAESSAGYVVVGACVPGARESRLVDAPAGDVPVVGALVDVPGALERVGADTVVVAASPGMDGEVLRSLSYALEGTGVDLVVAPALMNVAGNRITIRPVAGLPLLHVDEPELTGARRIAKSAFDRCTAALALLVLLPGLAVIAMIVRSTSAGPALFKQERVGRHGRRFQVWKFRSMLIDAEAMKARLQALNEADGPLFKVKADPRITPVGRVLRRYSLDELPQLVNVLRGDMSLVGPRPPLPQEVEQYEGHTARRLLVKPGITGLWQVSGRSDLSWDEAVRLDLHYVENWSLSLDISVLTRTAKTVLQGRGAY